MIQAYWAVNSTLSALIRGRSTCWARSTTDQGRGTGSIKPFACSYSTSTVALSDVARLHRRDIEEVLEEKWDLYMTAARECFETELENGRFMSTAFLARDILQIIDALGEDLKFWGKMSGQQFRC
jgi:hypothetical protein